MAFATKYQWYKKAEMQAARKTKEFKQLKNKIRFALLLAIFMGLVAYTSLSPGHGAVHGGRRLSGGGCGPETADMTAGHAIGWIIIIMYAFLGLAMICDDWFVPSLEKISEVLNLSPDVAGATFLAAGSSAPELFTSIADTFGPSNSIGIGTIVGSAMFNILIIVAMAAAATTEVLDIDWRPVVRDCGFYSLSILELILFFQDGQIMWWEGLIMTLSYGLYILFMVFNEKVFARCDTKKQVQPLEDEAEYKPGRRTSEHPHKGLFQGADRKVVLADGTVGQMEDGNVVKSEDVSTKDGAPPPPNTPPPNAKKDEEGEEEESYFHRFEFPKDEGSLDKFLWVVSFPLLCIFTAFVPDCGHPKAEKYYVVTFVMSIGMIGGLCHVMVQFATYVGCIFNIDPFIMGTMVLAVGTSVPDAMGSMIVARAGEADMAIANAVGSNVFDILLGLGLPWFMKGLILPEELIVVSRCGILPPVLILFSTVVLFFLVLIVNKWKMTNKLGIAFLVIYFFYIIYNLLKATNVVDEKKGCIEPFQAASSTSVNATRLL